MESFDSLSQANDIAAALMSYKTGKVENRHPLRATFLLKDLYTLGQKEKITESWNVFSRLQEINFTVS